MDRSDSRAGYVRPSFDLSGRVCLITGGSRGLGRAMAWGMAWAGADVVIASRNLDNCRRTASEIAERTGREALPIAVHVGAWQTLDDVVAQVVDHFGHLDVLVNNAGMSPVYDSAADITEELFDKVISVNLKGPFKLAVAAGTHMRARGGSIINVTSMAAVRPRADVLPYAAAKAGLNALTAGLAHTFGPRVRCNAIMAGTFATDIAEHWDPEVIAARTATFGAKRVGEPAEIVGTAIYLASDASSYTTGAVIAVDGAQP